MKKYWIVGAVVVAVIIIAVVMLHWKSDMSITETMNKTADVNVEENTEKASTEVITEKTGGDEVTGYRSITMDEAKGVFETAGDYIILDVRRADEFAEGHIPGAINIANEDITDAEPADLPDKDQTIYVYCRSGNRSKQAAEKLAAMGYTNIIEFGGIIDWTGDVVTDEDAEETTGMKMTINGTEVSVAWEDNDSVKEIMEAVPLTIEMSMYGGWEQVGSLGRSFTRNDVQQTAESGDIMLYSGNQLVVFYGNNSWAYTKLGKIQGMTEAEITELLSGGDVTITISK